MPGIDEELGMSEIATHKVIEKTYCNLDFTKLSGPNGDVDITGYKAAIDSGTSLIMGPNTVIQPLIEGITVNKTALARTTFPTSPSPSTPLTTSSPPMTTFSRFPTAAALSASWASRVPTSPTTSSTSSSVMSSCASTLASSALTTRLSPSTSSDRLSSYLSFSFSL